MKGGPFYYFLVTALSILARVTFTALSHFTFSALTLASAFPASDAHTTELTASAVLYPNADDNNEQWPSNTPPIGNNNESCIIQERDDTN